MQHIACRRAVFCGHEPMYFAEVSGCGCLEAIVRCSYPPNIRIFYLEDTVIGQKAAYLALDVAQLHSWSVVTIIQG